jgi:hypothetical protein
MTNLKAMLKWKGMRGEEKHESINRIQTQNSYQQLASQTYAQ